MDPQKFFFELSLDLPRQGPGDNGSTEKAFKIIPPQGENAILLDIGCGTGMHTIHLAKLLQGKIEAIDIYEPYLSKLRENARSENVNQFISTSVKSMDDLDLRTNSLDIIWSEGSIYIAGFEKGISYLRRFLKPEGFLVCSHICWLSENRPDELTNFWEAAYPEIKDLKENTEIVRNCGYELIDHFTLPEKSWWDNYYTPLLKKLESLHSSIKTDILLKPVIQENLEEIKMYRKYSSLYGYEFFIMRKH